MDQLQSYLLANLPGPAQQALPFLFRMYNTSSYVTQTVLPFLLPLWNKFLIFAQENNPLYTVGILVVSTFLLLKIVGTLRGIVMFWISLAWTIVFYGGIVLASWMIYTNGLEQTVTALMNWGKYVGEYWMEQYRQYDGNVGDYGAAARGSGYGYGSAKGDSRWR